LHPIVVRPDDVLIAGVRRFQACKQLGWTDVPVRIVDLDEIKVFRLLGTGNAHEREVARSMMDALLREHGRA
jgi:ParB-like chromosome segregation protein Spo0J